jgi:hypothetical protein
VRALALDGAIDPSLPPLRNLQVQGGGFDRALAAFLADCRRNRSCLWKPGGDLLTAYHTLMERIRRTPLEAGEGRKVTAGLAVTGVIATLYDKANGWPTLAMALQSAQDGDGSVLLELADLYSERDGKGMFSNLQEANLAVTCRDTVWPTDVAAYERAADDADRTAPEFGRTDVLSGVPCAFWPVRGLEPAAPSTAKPDRPVLVVGTTGDPATPYSGAQALVRQIRGSRLLTNVGEGHTGYGASACVRAAVDAYLTNLTLPAGTARCGG